jgi:CspA family cold shock protein
MPFPYLSLPSVLLSEDHNAGSAPRIGKRFSMRRCKLPVIVYISNSGFQPDDLAHLSRLWRVRLVTSSPEHRSIAAAAESPQHFSWKGSRMQIGVVKWFNSNKGFGFIQPEAGGPDVFVHVSAIERAGLPALVEGQKVGYELLVDKRSGKFSADSLQLQN